MNTLAVYGKACVTFISTLLGAGGAWMVTALADGHVTGVEWGGLVIVVGTVLAATAGVAITTNAQPEE